MATELFRANAALVRKMLAVDLGCDEAAFGSHELTVATLPPEARRTAEALAVTLGTGSVLSLPVEYAGWARHNQPEKHFRALQPFFLQDLADEMTRRGGRRATAHGITIGFTLSALPPEAALPAGFGLEQKDLTWMELERRSGVFDNALGNAHDANDLEKMLTAFVVRDPAGDTAAVAGIWDEGGGRMEIGLDVRRDVRANRLALPVAGAATRWIVKQGGVPIYTCGVTNVRSQRVALSCGYLPLWTVAKVWRAPEGRSAYDR